MNTKEVTEFFAGLSDQEKAAFLCRLAFEMTIVARETYEAGSEGLEDPILMRSVNELQHRILSHASSLLRGSMSRSDSTDYETVIWQILFDMKDKELKTMLGNALSHTLGSFTPILV
jgi:hypothetical protein